MLDAGVIGGIVGAAIGVAGGLLGTWMSIRSAKSGDRRRLMIRASIICWLGAVSFCALIIFLPAPWTWLLWVIYGPLLLLLILYINQAMRKMDPVQTVVTGEDG